MKIIKMRFGLAILVCWSSACVYPAIEESPYSLSVGLQLEKDTFLLGEPVRLIALITNTSDRIFALEKEPFHLRKSYREMVEIAADGDTKDFMFASYFEYLVISSSVTVDAPAIVIQPGEHRSVPDSILCWRNYFDRPQKDLELVFSHPGAWNIRFTVIHHSKKAQITKEIKVVSPEKEEDKKAFVWLMESNRLNRLQYYLDLIDMYPNRGFPPRAEFKALTALFPTSFYARYVAAIEAEQIHIRNAKRRKNPQYAKEFALKDLKAEGYDVDGFWDARPELRQEYDSNLRTIRRLWFDDKITTDEFHQQEANLLKEYITNYSRPLKPEEWKQRFGTEYPKSKRSEPGSPNGSGN